eukprot:CAMPEP_0179432932 /NCGR_PEP_ID=MMETSP0799-20121207/17425_1 /TAXON_ID=46947 /ORGANISM="Geminigera cryophila, Strain CCMP2564" /LENGTH=181 /DNA_ID=CAMNT_0021210563 /DNA_START=8 /DNA_END=553 /DNA_ORIENTATION=+
MNRSMEAHYQLQNRGFNVYSYGTGTNVRLPGPSQDRPNVFAFGTPYKDILADLKRKDEALYTHNGLITMLKRNVNVKTAPERWQDHDRSLPIDVVLTYEERVFDAVIQDLQSRDDSEMRPLHVINLDTRDNHEEAVAAAVVTCQLAAMLEELTDLETHAAKTIAAFEALTKRPTLYSLVYV